MKKSQLLNELYINAFNGNIDKVTSITNRLCTMGVSYRVQNKVLQFAHASCRVECIVDTIKHLIETEESFSLPALN